MYHLGSMAMYFFAGASMTHLLLNRLDERFLPREWQGTYAEVLPYVSHEFAAIVRELKDRLPARLARDAAQTIEQLCNPDTSRRGYPKRFQYNSHAMRYSIEPYVSLFDRLATRAEYESQRSYIKR